MIFEMLISFFSNFSDVCITFGNKIYKGNVSFREMLAISFRIRTLFWQGRTFIYMTFDVITFDVGQDNR